MTFSEVKKQKTTMRKYGSILEKRRMKEAVDQISIRFKEK